MGRSRPLKALLAALGLLVSLEAADSDRDFSGRWALDPAASATRALGHTEASLAIAQSDAGIRCSTGPVQWTYALDGSETRKRIGQETRSSIAKWEGAALLINTLVSGAQNYTVMERWVLSRDRKRPITLGNADISVAALRRDEDQTLSLPASCNRSSRICRRENQVV